MGAVLKSATSPLLRSARLRPVAERAIEALPSQYRVIARDVFDAGQNGAFYLPEPRFLYSDAARTTRISGPGDPWGGVTDLSGNGSHGAQPSDPDRPVYGVVPATGRRNLLTYTEEFDNATYWEAANGVITQVQGPTWRFQDEPTDTGHVFLATVSNIDWGGLGDDGVFTIEVKAESGRYIAIRPKNGSTFQQAGFDVQEGVVTWDGSSQMLDVSATLLPDGFVRCTCRYTGGLSGGAHVYLYDSVVDFNSNAESLVYLGTGLSVLVRKPRMILRTQADSIGYQRVGNQFDVTEAGVQSVHTLNFNLTNQSFSATLPAGTYTVALPGINGIWFDEVTHAGGTFEVGPTTYTGGPADLLEETGALVSAVAVEGSITAAEKARLKQYFVSLGAADVEITV